MVKAGSTPSATNGKPVSQTFTLKSAQISLEVTKALAPDTEPVGLAQVDKDTITYTAKVTNNSAVVVNAMRVQVTNGVVASATLDCDGNAAWAANETRQCKIITRSPDLAQFVKDGVITDSFQAIGALPADQNNLVPLVYSNTVKHETEIEAILKPIKTPLRDGVKLSAADSVQPGQKITYEVAVTNPATAKAIAKDVVFKDTPTGSTYQEDSFMVKRGEGSFTRDGLQADGGIAPYVAGINLGNLAIGETITVQYTVIVNAVSADVTSITNQASVKPANGPNFKSSPWDNPNIPGENIQKIAAVKAVIADPATLVSGTTNVGDKVKYEITVTNSGGIDLKDVAFTDTGICDAPVPVLTGTLAKGASQDVTCVHTITQVDVDAAKVTQQVKVKGAAASGVVQNVTADSNKVVTNFSGAAAGISLTVAKTIAPDADPAGLANPGDKINYSLTVKNTGAFSLTNVGVQSSTGAVVDAACTPASLAPNQTATCTFSRVAAPADLVADKYTDTFTATGTPANGGANVTDTKSVNTDPAVGVVPTKDAYRGQTQLNSEDTVKANEEITYEIVVNNPDAVTAENVVLKDTPVGSTYKPGSTQKSINGGPFTNVADGANNTAPFAGAGLNLGNIPSGEKITVRFTVIVNAGQAGISNQGFLKPSNGYEVKTKPTGSGGDIPTTNKKVAITAALTGTVVNSNGNTVVGDKDDNVAYTITVKNNGEVDLKDVNFTQGLGKGICDAAPVLASGDTDNNGILALTETWVYNCDHSLTQADVNAGKVTQQVEVNSKPNVGRVIDVNALSNPLVTNLGDIPAGLTLDITKVLNPDQDNDGLANENDKINYTVKVINNGSVTLTDVKLNANGANTGVVCDPVAPATLLPGGYTTCKYSNLVDAAEVAQGLITDTFKATGEKPNNAGQLTAEKAVTTDVAVSVIPTKVVNNASGQTLSGSDIVQVGDKLTYVITVKNPNPAAAKDVYLTDAPKGVTYVANSTATSRDGVNYTPVGDGPLGVAPFDPSVGSGNTAGLNLGNITKEETVYVRYQVTVNANAVKVENKGYLKPSNGPLVNTGEPNVNNVAGIQVDIASTSLNADGTKVVYGIDVHNLYNVPLTGVDFTAGPFFKGNCDATPVLASGDSAPLGTLTKPEVWKYTCEHTITQAERDNGSVENQVTIKGNPAGSTSVVKDDSEKVTTDISGSQLGTLELTLKAKSIDPDGDPVGAANVGDQINYTLNLKNTGNVTLNSVAATSSTSAEVVSACTPAILSPGASAECTFKNPVSAADIDELNKWVRDTFTGNAKTPKGALVNSAPLNVDTNTGVVVEAIKEAYRDGTALTSGVDAVKTGDELTYRITVTNPATQNLEAKDVMFTDTPQGATYVPGSTRTSVDGVTYTAIGNAQETAAPFAGDGLNLGKIASGKYVIVEFKVIVDAAPKDVVSNKGALKPSNGPKVWTKPTKNDVGGDPTINPFAAVAVKFTQNQVTDVNGDGTLGNAGDAISYTFTVTHSGSAVLTPTANGVRASACPAGTLSGPNGDGGQVGKLEKGEVWTYTCTRPIAVQDLNGSPVVNKATAEFTAVGIADPIKGEDTVNNNLAQAQGGLQVTVDAPNTAVINTPTEVKVDVTNNGQTNLYNPVIDKVTGCENPVSTNDANGKNIGDVNQDGVLDRGESWKYTCTATPTTLGDHPITVDAAGYDKPTAGAKITGTGTDTITVLAGGSKLEVVDGGTTIAVDKNSNGKADVDDEILYIFKVTNKSNLTADTLKLVDTMGSTYTCAKTSLVAGESTLCTAQANHKVTVAEVNAPSGLLVNTGTATAVTRPDGSQISGSGDVSTPVASTTGLGFTVEKKAAYEGGVLKAGSQFIYWIKVTNPNDVAANNVTVSDPKCKSTPTLAGSSATTTNLAPHAQAVFACMHEVSQAELDAGFVKNTATATGQTPTGTPVTGSNPELTTTLTQDKNLGVAGSYEFTQDADANGKADENDVVKLVYTLTNNGNITLHNPAVVQTGGITTAVTCDTAQLVPGAKATCTAAEHTVTAAQATGADITVTGNGTTDEASGQAQVAVPTIHTELVPAIGITKVVDLSTADANGNRDGLYTPGEKIKITFTVTNTGQTPLNGVSVTDPMCTTTPVTAGNTTLARNGDHVVFTCEHELTAAEVKAAKVVGTTATAQDTAGTTAQVTSPDLIIANRVMKVTAKGDVDTARVGEKINYTIGVNNAGNQVIGSIALVADRCDKTPEPVVTGGYNTGDTNKDGKLDPEETWNYTCSRVTVNGDKPKVINTVTATDTSPGALTPGASAKVETAVTGGSDTPPPPSNPPTYYTTPPATPTTGVITPPANPSSVPLQPSEQAPDTPAGPDLVQEKLPDPAVPSLAKTGSDVITLAIVAAGLAGVGLLIRFRSKRKVAIANTDED